MGSKKVITMAHGAGGTIMGELINDVILKELEKIKAKVKIEVPLEALDDSSVVGDTVFTTDSYVVKPLFFPGGDIGRLAVSGTINDLSVMGCQPLALSLGFIIEEGFPIEDVERILKSVAETCQEAEVPVVTGDTKVVEAGALDGMVINTSGIGRHWKLLENNIKKVRKSRAFKGKWLRDSNVKPGDKILISGTIGDHGISLLSFREGYGFESKVQSDAAPLNDMIQKALSVGGIVAMKDPTRGGVANALNEWASKSKAGIIVDENKLPFVESVTSACEMLGLDPLTIGNEGKILLAVVPEKADAVLEALRKTPTGKNAEIIGEATREVKGVVMRTLIGGKRIIDMPAGDPIPRIC
jgi:hydrogenase expression/formation protein HypE